MVISASHNLAGRSRADVLAEVDFRKPRAPVYSNVTGEPMDGAQEIRRLLVAQVVSPVRWRQTMENLLAQGPGTFYEVGPGRVLAGLLRRIDRTRRVENVMTLDAVSRLPFSGKLLPGDVLQSGPKTTSHGRRTQSSAPISPARSGASDRQSTRTAPATLQGPGAGLMLAVYGS